MVILLMYSSSFKEIPETEAYKNILSNAEVESVFSVGNAVN